jgi:hypothetical protein
VNLLIVVSVGGSAPIIHGAGPLLPQEVEMKTGKMYATAETSSPPSFDE